jgi:hypothetical protein
MPDELTTRHSSLGLALLYARRVRAYLVRRLHGWVYLFALTIVAVAILLVADGDKVLGYVVLLLAIPATWLGGVWVSPRGDDAYVLAMRDVIRGGAAEATNANRVRQDHMRILRKTITDLDPPRQLTDFHQQVVSQLESIDRFEADGAGTLEDRAVRMHEIRRELVRVLDDLTVQPSEPYVGELTCRIEDYMRETISSLDIVQKPFRQRSEKLTKIRPPQRWKARHEMSVKTFSDYFSALHNYYATLEDESIDAIRHAAKELAVQYEELTRFVDDYLQELGACYTGHHARDRWHSGERAGA